MALSMRQLPGPLALFFFFLKDTAPTEISPLPLHDALPISGSPRRCAARSDRRQCGREVGIDGNVDGLGNKRAGCSVRHYRQAMRARADRNSAVYQVESILIKNPVAIQVDAHAIGALRILESRSQNEIVSQTRRWLRSAN